MKAPILACAVLASFSVCLVAQRPAFDVASVKPNASGDPRQGIRSEPGGRIIVMNMPLTALITFAYQLADYQLVGAPAWAADERFDVVAKLPGDPTAVASRGGLNPIRGSMQTLLEERFKLLVHRETREMEMYALVMARPGGLPGPQLKRSSPDCEAIAAANRRGGPPPGPPKPGEPAVCSVISVAGLFRFGGFPLSRLVTPLCAQAGRMVIDRTGLTGNWDFDLRYAAEQPAPLAGAPAPAADPDTPSLFTALREQLGLRLESTRGSVDVLVIDRVELRATSLRGTCRRAVRLAVQKTGVCPVAPGIRGAPSKPRRNRDTWRRGLSHC
jgi:uncharacterized protein (TIGR03435 family)